MRLPGPISDWMSRFASFAARRGEEKGGRPFRGSSDYRVPGLCDDRVVADVEDPLCCPRGLKRTRHVDHRVRWDVVDQRPKPKQATADH
jgi:hypothetical protein